MSCYCTALPRSAPLALLVVLLLAPLTAGLLGCGSTEDPQLGLTSPDSTGDALPATEVEAQGLPGRVSTEWSAPERRTCINAAIAQIAVEDWSEENGGWYPETTGQANAAGHSVFDLLPEGRRLTNPFTFAPTEPLDGAAASPGQIGYWAIHQDGDPVGYTINAFGETREILAWVGTPDRGREGRDPVGIALQAMDPELRSLRNGLAVRRAARRWSEENGGAYPTNVGATNLLGHTLVDLLPGGILLLNPYTGANTEPVDGSAATPGQVGYLWTAGTPSGCFLDVHGDENVIWSWAPRGE